MDDSRKTNTTTSTEMFDTTSTEMFEFDKEDDDDAWPAESGLPSIDEESAALHAFSARMAKQSQSLISSQATMVGFDGFAGDLFDGMSTALDPSIHHQTTSPRSPGKRGSVANFLKRGQAFFGGKNNSELIAEKNSKALFTSRRSAFFRSEEMQQKHQRPVEISPLVTCLLLLILSYVIPDLIYMEQQNASILKEITPEVKYRLVQDAFAVVPSYIFLNWVFSRVEVCRNRLTGTGDSGHLCENSETKWIRDLCRPSWTVLFVGVIVLNNFVRDASLSVVKEEYHGQVRESVGAALAFVLAAVCISVLESIDGSLHRYAENVEKMLEQNPKSSKMQKILSSFSSHKDVQMDNIWGVPGGISADHPRSPARVLAEIVSIYVFLFEFVVASLLLLYFCGVNLYENIVPIAITVLMTMVVTALHIGEAVGTVIPLVLSNTIHIGEIISLIRPGSTPGDNPRECLVGFVEGVTWGHVVLRDFRKKQVHVPISEFRKLNVSNWTRRPAKLCHFLIKVERGLTDASIPLTQLAAFMKRWIKEHPSVDTEGYIKSAARLRYEYQTLECVFYPKIGKDAHQLRAEFLVVLSQAAKRLGICFLPSQVRMPYPYAQKHPNSEFGGPWFPTTTTDPSSGSSQVDNDDDMEEEEDDEATPLPRFSQASVSIQEPSLDRRKRRHAVPSFPDDLKFSQQSHDTGSSSNQHQPPQHVPTSTDVEQLLKDLMPSNELTAIAGFSKKDKKRD